MMFVWPIDSFQTNRRFVHSDTGIPLGRGSLYTKFRFIPYSRPGRVLIWNEYSLAGAFLYLLYHGLLTLFYR